MLLDTGDKTLCDAMEELDQLILVDHQGQEYPLSAKTVPCVFSIGRSRLCDVALQEVGVSSKHAQLVFDQNEWTIEDLASTNGIFVNGRPVAVKPIKNGDTLLIGKTRLTVKHSAEKPGKATTNHLFFLGVIACHR